MSSDSYTHTHTHTLLRYCTLFLCFTVLSNRKKDLFFAQGVENIYSISTNVHIYWCSASIVKFMFTIEKWWCRLHNKSAHIFTLRYRSWEYTYLFFKRVEAARIRAAFRADSFCCSDPEAATMSEWRWAELPRSTVSPFSNNWRSSSNMDSTWASPCSTASFTSSAGTSVWFIHNHKFLKTLLRWVSAKNQLNYTHRKNIGQQQRDGEETKGFGHRDVKKCTAASRKDVQDAIPSEGVQAANAVYIYAFPNM